MLTISVDSPGLFVNVADSFVVRNVAEKLRECHEPDELLHQPPIDARRL
jgi:hypothetical protein